MIQISFHGAAETVTGSKYLLEVDGTRVLFDCGLFQGLKELRLRNWTPLPIHPASVNSVLLTHAHIDHSGYLPRFVRDGFDGTVYATRATERQRSRNPDGGVLCSAPPRSLRRMCGRRCLRVGDPDGWIYEAHALDDLD